MARVNHVLDLWTTYCNSNQMSINGSKTSLIRITTRQKHQISPEDPIRLTALDENGQPIKPKDVTRLLGANKAKYITWKQRLETGERAVIPNLRRKLGALWLVSRHLEMRSRLQLANGIIISRMMYGV